jgi:putative N-acetylmannosamine-6-phosphate epimerase
LALFSNKEARKTVLVPSFDEIKQDYEQAVEKLLSITPDYQTVDDLVTEDQQLEFIKAFREVMRYNAQLQTLLSIKTKHNLINSTLRISHLNMLIYVVRSKDHQERKSIGAG